MKKNLMYLLAIMMLAILSLSSCNTEDDNVNEGSVAMEIFLNDTKKNTNLDIITIPIQYGETYGHKTLSVIFTFAETTGQIDPYVLTMMFEGVKLEEYNVGDDLTKLATYSYSLLGYKGNNYGLRNSDTSEDEFAGYQGQVLIKEFDKKNGIMKIEISNITLPIYKNIFYNPSNDKTIRIKGWVKDEILIH